MYKIASRNLQRAHSVDRPLPTGGYIGSSACEDDFIASADNLSREDCLRERRQLQFEMARVQNELTAAKRIGNMQAAADIGRKHQSLGQRLGLVRQRLHALSEQDEIQALKAAVKELCPPDLLQQIYARQQEIRARA